MSKSSEMDEYTEDFTGSTCIQWSNSENPWPEYPSEHVATTVTEVENPISSLKREKRKLNWWNLRGKQGVKGTLPPVT